MKVLITGVSGFIGSALAQQLLTRGHNIVGIGKQEQTKVEGIKYILADVLDKVKVEAQVAEAEVVVHLAALTAHKDIADNKNESLRINFQGTKNLLEAFHNSPTTKKFIYASTGKVYGKIESLPITENHPTAPLNILGKSKLIAEKLIDFYTSKDKSQIILRIFNVYGPGQKDNFLVPTILNQLKPGLEQGSIPEIILGDLASQRDYTYVEDVINALVLAVETESKPGTEIYNVSSQIGTSAAEIVEVIGEIINHPLKVKVESNLFRPDEEKYEYGYYTKIKSQLGWKPHHDLKAGLKKTVENFLKESNLTKAGAESEDRIMESKKVNKKMKILITGAAGFIGSNLAAELVARGYEVVALDDLSLGRKDNLNFVWNKIKFVEGSINNEKLVESITTGVDCIVNLAAASASPMFRLDNVKEAVQTNVGGFMTMLRSAVKNKFKRLLYASTSSVYGNNTPPLTEEMKLSPPNMYAATKLENEFCAKIFSQEYGLETVGYRFMSVYGPNEESKGYFSNLATQFVWKTMQGQELVIYGDGNQTRDFTYVKDIVQAITLGIESKQKLMGEVFNVGSGESYSLNQLVNTISKK